MSEIKRLSASSSEVLHVYCDCVVIYSEFGLISDLMPSVSIFEAFGFTQQGGGSISFSSSSAHRSKETCFSVAPEFKRSFLKVLRSQGYWPKFPSMHRAFLCTRRILLQNCACRDSAESLSHFLVMRPITISILHSVCACLAPSLFVSLSLPPSISLTHTHNRTA